MKPFDTKTPTVGLNATEQDVRGKLIAGDAVVFPDGDPGQRVIRAEWLLNPGPDGAIAAPVLVSNAVIRENLVSAYTVFKRAVSLVGCVFNDKVDLRGARFEGPLILKQSEFLAPVTLTQIDVRYDLRLSATRFTEIDMRDAHIGEALMAYGTEFSGRASFIRLKVDKAAFFTPIHAGGDIQPARFYGPVTFVDATFSVTAEFDSAYFGGEANFIRVSIGAEAFFRRAAIALDVDSDRLVPVPIEKQLPVIFAKDVAFRDAAFHGVAKFENASFQGNAEFSRMNVGSDALFGGAVFFHQVAFDGATVGADFMLDGTSLGQSASMQRMTVPGALDLTGAQAICVDLRRTRAGLMMVSGAQLGSIDFGGAGFERFDGDWRAFTKGIEPFSRDPYDAVERHLRSAGEEREAGDVYYARRKREGRELRQRFGRRVRHRAYAEAWRDFPRVLLDLFEHYVSSYGVRSVRLFTYMLVLLIAGGIMFSREDALVPKTPPKPPEKAVLASREESIVYAVALAIPLVQLPPVERWRPSERPIGHFCGYRLMTFETFASIYRLFGFLFVPLAVAVVTGLLYRRDRT